ncbi:ribosome-recycling factor, mitochondrial isoform X2 [Caloenas nicobarica]|uniref:ribosome-recycling factor, mitochondrial isoform X2 n=1 Tax=Caloenas nicobarica TaxID=187106 RepID=UPI0032B709E1
MAMALRCFRHLPSLLHRSRLAALRGPPRAPPGCPALLPSGCSHCGHRMLPSRQLATKKGALDHIIVVTKDGKFPLNQLGQISQKSPQLLIVNMASFPESTAAATKAIRESGMNLNPEADGTIIRVPVPKVTREHRESLAKLAKQSTNKSKEALRKVRSKSVNQVKKFKNKVSEDTIWLLEKQIQQMADSAAAEMDKLLAAKTKELLG